MTSPRMAMSRPIRVIPPPPTMSTISTLGSYIASTLSFFGPRYSLFPRRTHGLMLNQFEMCRASLRHKPSAWQQTSAHAGEEGAFAARMS